MFFALKENGIVPLDRIGSRGHFLYDPLHLVHWKDYQLICFCGIAFSVSILCDRFRRISRRQANKDMENSFAFWGFVQVYLHDLFLIFIQIDLRMKWICCGTKCVGKKIQISGGKKWQTAELFFSRLDWGSGDSSNERLHQFNKLFAAGVAGWVKVQNWMQWEGGQKK